MSDLTIILWRPQDQDQDEVPFLDEQVLNWLQNNYNVVTAKTIEDLYSRCHLILTRGPLIVNMSSHGLSSLAPITHNLNNGDDLKSITDILDQLYPSTLSDEVTAHFVWLGMGPLPLNYALNLERWSKFAKVNLWTKEKIDIFIAAEDSYTRANYDRIRYAAPRLATIWVRGLIVERQGGMSFDLSYFPHTNLSFGDFDIMIKSNSVKMDKLDLVLFGAKNPQTRFFEGWNAHLTDLIIKGNIKNITEAETALSAYALMRNVEDVASENMGIIWAGKTEKVEISTPTTPVETKKTQSNDYDLADLFVCIVVVVAIGFVLFLFCSILYGGVSYKKMTDTKGSTFIQMKRIIPISSRLKVPFYQAKGFYI